MCTQSNMYNTTRTHHSPPLDSCGHDPVLYQCVSPLSILLMDRCFALFTLSFDRHNKYNNIYAAHNTPLHPNFGIPYSHTSNPCTQTMVFDEYCILYRICIRGTVHLMTLKPSKSRGESPDSGIRIHSALKY